MSTVMKMTHPQNKNLINLDVYKNGVGRINLALKNNVIVNFSREDTLQTIYDQITSKSVAETKSLHFYTSEGALVPLNEKINDLTMLPILMQINNSSIFALNFQDEFTIEDLDSFDTENPEFLYEFSKSIGLKNSEKYLYPCFLQKVSMSLPRGRNFSASELSNCVNEVMMYMQNKGDDDEVKNLKGMGLNTIQSKLIELEALSSKNA